MRNTTLTGKVVLEWLEKWPELPNLTLARMIYNKDDNHKLFTSIDHTRAIIRYYKGTIGKSNKDRLANRTFIKDS